MDVIICENDILIDIFCKTRLRCKKLLVCKQITGTSVRATSEHISSYVYWDLDKMITLVILRLLRVTLWSCYCTSMCPSISYHTRLGIRLWTSTSEVIFFAVIWETYRTIRSIIQPRRIPDQTMIVSVPGLVHILKMLKSAPFSKHSQCGALVKSVLRTHRNHGSLLHLSKNKTRNTRA